RDRPPRTSEKGVQKAMTAHSIWPCSGSFERSELRCKQRKRQTYGAAMLRVRSSETFSGY
ncbi:hypothetical protein, partial [Paraburkholderia sp. SIMBA_053]|uniref:hypothetical protein n=1 Tax=Paraburkholderia sp. SIMBA_053 TaxID=3085794 RepID=UPI00397A5C2A